MRANASKQRYVVEQRAAVILAEAGAPDAADDELGRDKQEMLLGSGSGSGRGRGGAGGQDGRLARFGRAAEALAEEAGEERPADARKPSNAAKGRVLAAARKRGPNLTDPESRVTDQGGQRDHRDRLRPTFRVRARGARRGGSACGKPPGAGRRSSR